MTDNARYMLVQTAGGQSGDTPKYNGVVKTSFFATLDAMKEAAEAVFREWADYGLGIKLEPGDCLDENGDVCESIKWSAAHRTGDGCDGWLVHDEQWERLESFEWNETNRCYDRREMW